MMHPSLNSTNVSSYTYGPFRFVTQRNVISGARSFKCAWRSTSSCRGRGRDPESHFNLTPINIHTDAPQNAYR